MKRKQIYLDIQAEIQLKELAAETHLSEAEHIRRALNDYLAERKPVIDDEEDPLLKLIGLVPAGLGKKDASINHDIYLYGRDEELRGP